MEKLRVVVEQARGEKSYACAPGVAEAFALRKALEGRNTRVTTPVVSGKAQVLAFFAAHTGQKFAPPPRPSLALWA